MNNVEDSVSRKLQNLLCTGEIQFLHHNELYNSTGTAPSLLTVFALEMITIEQQLDGCIERLC